MEKRNSAHSSTHLEFSKVLSKFLTKEDRPSSWLARKIGVARATVTRWVNGETMPEKATGEETIREICGALKLTRAQRKELFMAAGYEYNESDEDYLHRLERDAEEWSDEAKSVEYLYEGDRLEECIEFLNGETISTREIVYEFKEASLTYRKLVRRKEKWRQVYILTLAGFLGGAIGGILGYIIFNNELDPRYYLAQGLYFAFYGVCMAFVIGLCLEFSPWPQLLSIISATVVGTAISAAFLLLLGEFKTFSISAAHALFIPLCVLAGRQDETLLLQEGPFKLDGKYMLMLKYTVLGFAILGILGIKIFDGLTLDFTNKTFLSNSVSIVIITLSLSIANNYSNLSAYVSQYLKGA